MTYNDIPITVEGQKQKPGEIAVIKNTLLTSQLCIPKQITTDEAEKLMNVINFSGTDSGWGARRSGCDNLAGDPERVQCSQFIDHVHITFEC